MKKKHLIVIVSVFFIFVVMAGESFCQDDIQSAFLAINDTKIDSTNIDNSIPCAYENSAQGRTTGIPANHYLWLVVHPEGSGGYWPQVASIVTQDRNNYWTTKFWLGTRATNLGEIFEVWLILVNDAGNDIYLQYLENGKATGKYPEISLPKGHKTVDMLTVIKQSN